jgi:hypothetical protein
MASQEFKNLYVLKWNPATNMYWCGTVKEALVIDAHNYGARDLIVSMWRQNHRKSAEMRHGLTWLWIAVAESREELQAKAAEIQASG